MPDRMSVSALVDENGFAGEDRRGEMIYRRLGRTGEHVSAIGMGGSHMGEAESEEVAIRIIRSAIDRGLTFMDNCWDYHEGRSERWMGHALRDGYRSKAFLMTKFDGRTKEAAAKQIDESLQRLETDYVDLLQFHENIRLEDPDRFFSEGGAMEAVLEAKKAGKARYIGFTGHKDPIVHLRMLESADKHEFHFDTVQMPVNILDAQFRSFTNEVLPKAIERGVAVLGMKPQASGAIPENGIATAIECLHFALSMPTSVVITGCENPQRVEQAFAAVRTFKPLSKDGIAALLRRTREAALSGKYELFKTSPQYDSTAKHPEWLG